jgi:hypothetical protein
MKTGGGSVGGCRNNTGVESGPAFCKLRRVGSRNLNIYIHVFHSLQNLARTEKL